MTFRIYIATVLIALGLSTPAIAQTHPPVPFKIDVPQEKLERVLGQLKDARFPDRLGNGDWSNGASSLFLEEFRDYITTKYDWRKTEARLNAFPQFMAKVDGYELHYFHVKGEGLNPTPLILSHGWPGSVYEFLHLIGPLTTPSKFGGDAKDAFTVIVPSVPGYGWSELATNKVIGPKTTADLFHKLMTDVLGYQSYGAQGGDIGSLIVSQMAARYPKNVLGVHMNIVPWDWKPVASQTQEEKDWFAKGQVFQRAQFDYFFMQAQEPTTVAFALHDNAVGLSAWILDKIFSWTDHQGAITDAISMDDLATFIMIYALTDTIDTSVWWYKGILTENGGIFHPTPGQKVGVPTGFVIFPRDLLNALPPRTWVEGQYNIVHWTDMQSGGHFAAVEEPDLFLNDVRKFFRLLR